jgi:L-lysine 2,3-aminomutase
MAEIDKKKLARIVGHEKDSELLKKQAAIIKDKNQYSVRIPTRFAELAQIDQKTDKIEFTLIPSGEHGQEFTIEAELKRG